MDRIVVGTTGGADLPHMKYRLGPLAQEGSWPVEVVAAGTFPGDDDVEALFTAGSPGSVLVLQRVLPTPSEIRRLRQRYDAVVLDFDDAIYETMPDLRQSALRGRMKETLRLVLRGSRTASGRKQPLIKALREADACVVGNDVLAQFARSYTDRVMVIPSTVEPIENMHRETPEPPVLVWTGVAGNRQYLELLRKPLAQLADEVDFRLRVVCSRNWEDPPVDVEFVTWSPEAEREALRTATAGLAPLTDDPFSRGKCQYRSIVFGGHGLATVASPVGIMDSIIVHGETGFLAGSDEEWCSALRSCMNDPGLAVRLGANALHRIRRLYSHQVGVELWTRFFNDLALAGASERAVSGSPGQQALPARRS
jgi:hypothetical protein